MTRRTLIFGLAAATTAAAADSVASAQKAAESWLALLDGGDYQSSWEQAAAFFKKQVTAEQWKAAATKVRIPLGAVNGRTLAGAQAATSLPGAPDGEYVVIQYKTEFAQKKNAVETITPMKDPDGVWRVSGYFVR
jgi:hypothetical protein